MPSTPRRFRAHTPRGLMAALLVGIATVETPAAVAPAGDAPVVHDLTFVSVPGIPRDVVPSLAQDGEGFLWIGTGDGLARYDGYRLTMVEREGDDPVARNMGWIRAMAAGPDGRVWMGTESSGLAVYVPDRRRILTLGGPDEGRQASIVALGLDGDGRVWIGTAGEGLLRYDDAARRFERLALPGAAPGEGQASAFASGPDGHLWIGHWGGLAQWRPGATALEAVPLPPLPDGHSGEPVQALLATADGRLWVGTPRGHLGVRDAQGRMRWLPAEGRGGIQALAVDAEGTLWVGHRSGLDLLDAATGALRQRLLHRADQPGGLAGNDVTQLMRDRNGAMWVAGFGVGLQRQSRSPAIAVRGPDPNPSGAFGHADVRALLALDDQRVLAATATGGVTVLDADLRVLGAWPHAGPPVDAMSQDAQGDVWLAVGGRVQRKRADGRLLAEWETGAGKGLWLEATADGTVWLGAERGLLRWRPEANRFEPVLDTNGKSLDREVFAFAPDGQGGFWVGGRAGLHQLPAGEDRLVPAAIAPEEGLGFPLVLGLLRDRQGTLWVDTPVAGLHRLRGKDAEGRLRFERISVRHGVVGRPFGANLHEDARGRIWSQAFVYDPARDRLDELRAADGVQIGTPWFGADTRLADGRLLFGGSRGLMRVVPERYEPSADAPPLVFSGFRVNGLPHVPASVSEGLVLPPGTRSFGIEFAALEFADPDHVHYRYRLAGYDPAWVPTDATFRNPSYSELAPGRYVFEVQATNRSGVWTPGTLRLPVVVQPRWWQAAWLPWVLALALVAAIWGWVRWRTAALREREALLEAVVAQRTAELREVSLTDPLTGLRNRRYVAQRIAADLAAARRGHGEQPGRDDADLLVFLIDLDHFKTINDRLGHAAGDAVLVRTAQVLRQVFRDSDTLVRWGGEEFLVVARGRRRDAAALAERLRHALKAGLGSASIDGQPTLPITASTGFVAYPPDVAHPDAWSWDAVLQLADAALYAAKSTGRDAWVGVASSPAEAAAHGDASGWIAHPGTVIERSD